MKQKKILITFWIFLSVFAGIFAWSKFRVGKNVKADVEILKGEERGEARIRDETETVSIKVISQEKQENKLILYLEDGTELSISDSDLISDEQEQVYESCDGIKIVINQEGCVVSKRKEESETSNEISRKEKSRNED